MADAQLLQWPEATVLDSFAEIAGRVAEGLTEASGIEIKLLGWQAATKPRYMEMRVSVAGNEMRLPIAIYSLTRFYENRKELLRTGDDSYIMPLEKTLIKVFQWPLVQQLEQLEAAGSNQPTGSPSSAVPSLLRMRPVFGRGTGKAPQDGE